MFDSKILFNSFVRISRTVIIIAFLNLNLLVPAFSQDVIVLHSGDEIQAKILSRKGPLLSYIPWDNADRSTSTIDKKLVKRYLMEYLMKERWSLSFSLGGSSFGTSKQLKNHMIDNGYNQRVQFPLLVYFPYPIIERKASWKVELEYVFKMPHGFSVEIGQTNSGSIQGYNGRDFTPKLIFLNPQFSAGYKHYYKNLRSYIQTGVIVNFAKIKEEDNDYQIEESKVRPGIFLGMAAAIVEKRSYFVRLEAQYRHVFPIEISNSALFLNNMKIRLNHFYIGVQIGVKIYPENK